MGDAWVVLLALSAALGSLAAVPIPLLLGVALGVIALRRRVPVLLCLAVAATASALSARAWRGLDAPLPRHVAGEATLVSDPARVPPAGAIRLVVRLEGRLYQAEARDDNGEALASLLAGERVSMAGSPRPLPAAIAPALRRRHVAALLEVDRAAFPRRGHPSATLANAVRRTLVRGAASLPEPQGPLFAGFVLGDDRGQDTAIVEDFRASGLSHLLVVSGQNVAFILALASPLVRRGPIRTRIVFVGVVLGVFGVLTRWEPSVLRAVAMAAITYLAAGSGRVLSRARALALAVTAALLVDPLLAGSISFLLSVGACAGIALLAAPIAARLPGPKALADTAALTIAAQVGVSPVLAAVFGGVPLASLPANMLAAPAAAPVTVWGLPAGLVAGLTGGPLATALHFPTRILLGWIAGVARWAAAVPLGRVGILPIALATATLTAGARWPRLRMPLAAAALAAMALAVAARSGPPPFEQIDPGAQLWRAGGAVVLAVDGRASPRLVGRLRERGVRSVDLLVVRTRAAAARAAVVPLMSRMRVRAVIAPAGASITATAPPQGSIRVGSLSVTVSGHERLDVVVLLSR